MLDGIRSEWWAPSDQNAWTASLGIRTSSRKWCEWTYASGSSDALDVAAEFFPLGKATLRAVLGQHELDEMPGPKPGVSR